MKPVKNKPAINLIVGADSLIGSGLLRDYLSTDNLTIGTSRRSISKRDKRVPLDLNSNISEWRPPGPVKTAYICAGVTSLTACNSDPNATARVNVSAVSELVRKLVDQGAFVVYISTNQVFDGTLPYCMPDMPFSPVTEYGRQKAETELNIRDLGDSVSIVRFTKILGPDYPLFSSWANALRAGKSVQPYSNMYMAPVPLAYAISALRIVGDKRISGTTQISGQTDISYAEAACIGSNVLKTDINLIKPVKVPRSGFSEAVLPFTTTLNTDRAISLFGAEPPDTIETVRAAFQTL